MFKIKASKKPVFNLAFSPDGTRLASIGDQTLRVWDMSSRELIWENNTKEKSRWYSQISFSPDGIMLAGIERPSTKLVMWNAETGKQFSVKGTRSTPKLNSTESLMGLRDAILVYDSNFLSAKRFTPFPDSPEFLPGLRTPIILSADNQLIATFMVDGRISIFDWRKQLVKWILGSGSSTGDASGSIANDWIRNAAFQPHGRIFVTASNLTLRAWDLETGTQIAANGRRKGKHFQDIIFSADGRFLLSGANDKIVRFWNPENLTEQKAYDWKIGEIRVLAVSPDGLVAAAAGTNGTIVVWDMDD